MQFQDPICKTRINRYQQLFTAEQWAQLTKNHQIVQDSPDDDVADLVFVAVVRFFATCSPAQWVLTEAEVFRDEDGQVEDVHCFGFCDMGFGCGELGTVSMRELVETSRLGFRTQIERDTSFTPAPLSTWPK